MAELLTNRNIVLTTTQKLKMNEDAARGLAWLHGSGIVHRDVKVSLLVSFCLRLDFIFFFLPSR